MKYAPLLYPPDDEHLILGAHILGPFFNTETAARQVAAKELAQAQRDGLPLAAWVVQVQGEEINSKVRVEARTPNGAGAKVMDPNACFRRWADAIARDDDSEAEAAAADLIDWINKGGFEPSLWKDAKLKRIFVQWVRDSIDDREPNPKGAKKESGAAKASKKMSSEDKGNLIKALREFGALVLKGKPKNFSKSEAIQGVVLAASMDRKEVMAAVRKVLPAPPKKQLTEEEKQARLAKRMASCEKLLAGRGEKPKPAPAPSAPSASEPKAEPKAEAPKKKRGRPPKAKVEAPAEPKRPRGRPSKAKVAAPAAPTVEVEVKPSGATVVEVTPPAAPVAPVAAPAPAPVVVPAPAARPAMTQEEKMAYLQKALAGILGK